MNRLKLWTSIALLAASTASSPASATNFKVRSFATGCKGVAGYAASAEGRRTFLWDPTKLAEIKATKDRTAATKAAYDKMVADADAALGHRPGSVMDKSTYPPSGDRHDYLSVGRYYWPDPASPGGPYVTRDGETNPQSQSAMYDRVALGTMSDDVLALALAYFYTSDQRYADKAAVILRTWFLDPSTRMNPNADYAQGRPNDPLLTGRPYGVLDTAQMQPVVDSIGLLTPSGSLSKAEITQLQKWFGRYVDWLAKSSNGIGESAASNNHGLWFDSQLAEYALFSGRLQTAKAVVTAFARKRIAVQFEEDGSFPAESTRTRSLHYSVFAMLAALNVAQLGGCVGVDLFHYAGHGGRGIRRSIDFLARFSGSPEAWRGKELDMRDAQAELDILLARASMAFPDYQISTASYPGALLYKR